jgi:hypothetical protein
MDQILVIAERIVIYSVLISALYALVALGFTMIFGVARVSKLSPRGVLDGRGVHGVVRSTVPPMESV